jgi:DNA-binding GntR family transcriptional regulator
MNAQSDSLTRRLTLADQVYEILRSQILDMDLPPGTRLKDSELAVKLGMSNTPVREALRRLEEAELVETVPRRGTFVKQLSLREVEGLYEVRSALEVLAVRLAAVRSDDTLLEQVDEAARLHVSAVQRGAVDEFLEYDRRFHDLIAEGADNPILASMLTSLADRIHIVRRMDLGRRQDEMSGEEHFEIAKALLQRDGDEAARLMEYHIREHKGRVLDMLNESEDPDAPEASVGSGE